MDSAGEVRRALDLLGRVLQDRESRYAIVVAGGAALLLHEALSRSTQDVDVVAAARADERLRPTWQLPEELERAAADVAETLGLPAGWLNAGAGGLLSDRLPDGFADRATPMTFGNLVVLVMDRLDLLRLKVLAAIDEGPGSRHFLDVLSLRPTTAESREALDWCLQWHRSEDPLVQDVARALGVAGER